MFMDELRFPRKGLLDQIEDIIDRVDDVLNGPSYKPSRVYDDDYEYDRRRALKAMERQNELSEKRYKELKRRNELLEEQIESERERADEIKKLRKLIKKLSS